LDKAPDDFAGTLPNPVTWHDAEAHGSSVVVAAPSISLELRLKGEFPVINPDKSPNPKTEQDTEELLLAETVIICIITIIYIVIIVNRSKAPK
jgi:hypothetical protein